MESYAAKLQNEEYSFMRITVMAALLYRDRITEAPILEGEYDDMQY